MMSQAFFSSTPSLPINGSSTKHPSPPLFLPSRPSLSSLPSRKQPFPIKATSDSTTVLHNESVSSSSSGDSTAVRSSHEEKAVEAESDDKGKIGARVRVKVPLKVYHLPKVPEFELSRKIGVLKQYVGVWKGKHVSANLPYKVQFVEKIEDREVKFFAHLREDEFEYI